ncbi:helix-turn-helix transcriptional regulator [Bacteroides sp.]|jgi:transcriptional regulator with XRE-family HTH domain|uniref:helix-turn-helix domain-containing protein n=1 Tax=Bacteroides sp. TaxID=29523 RepID=UPI002590ED07|nr:helix-turn-helix transcriptional regulator [Bacteroides sp.]
MNEQQLFIKIGDKIKELRELKNLSQQDLAALCNFEKSNMSRIEAGRSNLTIKTLFKISNALKVPLKDLVSID